MANKILVKFLLLLGTVIMMEGLLFAADADTKILESNFDEGLYHITADKKLYHAEGQVAEAFGNVVISGHGQRLSADYVWFNRDTFDVKARGNVVYVTNNTVTEATEMHFNLNTKLGTIFYGRVMTDQYLLKGQLIRKVSEDRFITTDGEYSACRDCPEAWRIAAKRVDMQIEGYALMTSVTIIIKDIPTLYLPFMILPVKKKRQSGLLVPTISQSRDYGFGFLQPLYLALDDHQDATLSWGRYGRRGNRAEGEYRFKSYDSVEGILKTHFQEDVLFQDKNDPHKEKRVQTLGIFPDRRITYRGSIITQDELPIFKYAKMKFLYQDISDRDYVTDYGRVIGANEAAVPSQFVLQSNHDNYFVSGEMKRYRSIVTHDLFGFDKSMVQASPSIYYGVKERSIWGPLYGNISGRFDNYVRGFGQYTDINKNGIFDPSTERLRQTQRAIFTPELSTPFRLGKFIALTPSLQYNEMEYLFNIHNANGTNIGNTSRRYLLWRMEANTVFEKVFDYDGVGIEKLKHQISPSIIFSNVPWFWQNPEHPFTDQLKNVDGGFDRFDYVPLTNSDLNSTQNFDRFPVGKSVEVGLYSRLIRKHRKVPKIPPVYPYDLYLQNPKVYPEPHSRMNEYQIAKEKRWDQNDPRYGAFDQIWDFSIDQAYDFKAAQRRDDGEKMPYSFLEANSNLSIDNFSNAINYKYLPYVEIPYDDNIMNDIKSRTPSAINALSKHDILRYNSLPVYKRQHQVSYSVNWTFKDLTHPRGILFIKRAIGFEQSIIGLPTPVRNFAFNIFWSLNENLAFNFHEAHDLITRKVTSRSLATLYTPGSECWRLQLNWSYSDGTDTSEGKRQNQFSFNFGFNLWGGASFLGVTDFQQQANGFLGQPG